MKKTLSILMVALLACSLLSCSREPITPEAIYHTIIESEHLRMEMVVNYDDIQSSTTVIEEEGDRTHVRMETESFGAVSGDEYYTDVLDGKRYIISQDQDGTWKKEPVDQWITPATVAGLKDLFDNDLYHEEDGRFIGYKDSEVKLDDMTFGNLELQMDEDGTYRLTAVVTRVIDEMPVFGKATITITTKDVTVTIPTVK